MTSVRTAHCYTATPITTCYTGVNHVLIDNEMAHFYRRTISDCIHEEGYSELIHSHKNVNKHGSGSDM